MNAAAYDLHRPGTQCLKPTEVGLTVAPRIRLTCTQPSRVPISFDMFGNAVEFVEADPGPGRLTFVRD